VTQNVPQLPPRLTDPRPVLAVGSALWLIATVVVWAGGDRWASARPICLMGLVVGLIALVIYLVQRRGARRGDKGAQTGL
jgi:flagellar biogenesis protein FliO